MSQNNISEFEAKAIKLAKEYPDYSINIVVRDIIDNSIHIMGNMCAACAMEELAQHVMWNKGGLHDDGKMAMVTEINGIKQ